MRTFGMDDTKPYTIYDVTVDVWLYCLCKSHAHPATNGVLVFILLALFSPCVASFARHFAFRLCVRLFAVTGIRVFGMHIAYAMNYGFLSEKLYDGVLMTATTTNINAARQVNTRKYT